MRKLNLTQHRAWSTASKQIRDHAPAGLADAEDRTILGTAWPEAPSNTAEAETQEDTRFPQVVRAECRTEFASAPASGVPVSLTARREVSFSAHPFP